MKHERVYKKRKETSAILNNLIQKFLNENGLVFGSETVQYQKLRHICAYYLN